LPATSLEVDVNSRRLVIALLGALLISGGCTLLLGRNMAHRPVKSAPKIQYIAASGPIAAGEIVKPEQLSLMDWPSAQPVDGAFKKSEAVAGRVAVYPMAKGQIVLDKYLAAPGSGIGLTTRIADGMRAIALKSDEVVGVAGFLFPGSRVDVLVTYRPPQGSDPITSTVLQNAQVVAVGHQIQPDPAGKPTTVDVVTILAKPQDAEKVVLAHTGHDPFCAAQWHRSGRDAECSCAVDPARRSCQRPSAQIRRCTPQNQALRGGNHHGG
jgi:pilus assembly protein CpaB